jgi:hypothetical protein
MEIKENIKNGLYEKKIDYFKLSKKFTHLIRTCKTADQDLDEEQ